MLCIKLQAWIVLRFIIFIWKEGTMPQLLKEAQLVAQAFKKLIQWRRLTTNSKYHVSVGLLWRHRLSRYSMSQFWAPFPIDLKPIVFFKCHLSYSYQTVTDLVYLKKAITPRCLNYLGCHFFVRAHRNGTLKPKLGFLTNFQDKYIRATCNINPSRILLSIFHSTLEDTVQMWYLALCSGWNHSGGR